ncbi:MAG: hypothetical protein Ct9H300mP31_16970 [Acidimicrobiaceae bacterium]|nr:MAG: hypothetical protein Ct9H300mP31_16970 [Acidimicrobiaceae bacterium]
MRHSLSYGGVPGEPKFRFPRPAKPEIMVVADISGAVAAFARFTLHLVYAISSQFSKVRSFVFIDGLDEVTGFFEGVEDIGEAVHRVNTEADVVWVDGHSDYGHAFGVFWEKYGKEVGPKTTVLVLGDARNNYHASQSWILKEVQHRARKVFWLNPEPKAYWDTGIRSWGSTAPGGGCARGSEPAPVGGVRRESGLSRPWATPVTQRVPLRTARPGGRPGRGSGCRSAGGPHGFVATAEVGPGSTAAPPPRHSVTSSPVSSR